MNKYYLWHGQYRNRPDLKRLNIIIVLLIVIAVELGVR